MLTNFVCDIQAENRKNSLLW